jgi:GNAT superfamily N-acetyltransferase
MESIIVAENNLHGGDIREIWEEYLCWVVPIINDLYQTRFDLETLVEEDMKTIDRFMPSKGCLVLAYVDNQLAGMIGLKPLSEQVGEIKRMYVRPQFRKNGLGHRLVQKLLCEAEKIGYDCLRLDSAQFMEGAHRLYRSFGFVEIPPYEGTEIPELYHPFWVFMEKQMEA